jgi:transposase
MLATMAQRLLTPNPENASILELKALARLGSSETALRCTAIQMLVVGISREQVCLALLVTERALPKWINAFNRSGVDGLIVNKRPGRTALVGAEQAEELAAVVEHPIQAGRTFWTAKAFHGYISEAYQIECSYETVLRFFHRQGYALKVPQPWPDRQDEAERQRFREKLKELCAQPDVDIWFADESGFDSDPRPRRRWDLKGRKTRATKNGDHLRTHKRDGCLLAPKEVSELARLPAVLPAVLFAGLQPDRAYLAGDATPSFLENQTPGGKNAGGNRRGRQGLHRRSRQGAIPRLLNRLAR